SIDSGLREAWVEVILSLRRGPIISSKPDSSPTRVEGAQAGSTGIGSGMRTSQIGQRTWSGHSPGLPSNYSCAPEGRPRKWDNGSGQAPHCIGWDEPVTSVAIQATTSVYKLAASFVFSGLWLFMETVLLRHFSAWSFLPHASYSRTRRSRASFRRALSRRDIF